MIDKSHVHRMFSTALGNLGGQPPEQIPVGDEKLRNVLISIRAFEAFADAAREETRITPDARNWAGESAHDLRMRLWSIMKEDQAWFAGTPGLMQKHDIPEVSFEEAMDLAASLPAAPGGPA